MIIRMINKIDNKINKLDKKFEALSNHEDRLQEQVNDIEANHEAIDDLSDLGTRFVELEHKIKQLNEDNGVLLYKIIMEENKPKEELKSECEHKWNYYEMGNLKKCVLCGLIQQRQIKANDSGFLARIGEWEDVK